MSRLTIETPAVMSMGFLDTKECDIYRKLQHYEDLERDGLLLELPCRIGNTIYQLDYETFTKEDGSEWKRLSNEHLYIKEIKFGLVHLDNIGKYYWLTREEAEEELKRRQSR